MPRYSIQVVMGLAGSGSLPTVILFRNTARPRLRVGLPPQLSMANLDPAAEHFEYELIFDIRDLVSVAEVTMEGLGLGPKGALLYCIEYLLKIWTGSRNTRNNWQTTTSNC